MQCWFLQPGQDADIDFYVRMKTELFFLFFYGLSLFLGTQAFQAEKLPALPEHQFVPLVEIFLENNTDTLRSQIRTGIVTVVRFIVGFQPDFSGASNQPFGFEVTHKVRIGHRIIPITEVSIDEQTVIQQLTGQHAFELHIGPSLFAGTEISSYIPIIIIDNLGQSVI